MEVVIAELVRRRIEREKKRQLYLKRRELRNTSFPMEKLTQRAFVEEFRLTKRICGIFLELIMPHMEDRMRTDGLTKEQRIFCALRFLAVGCYQRPIGQDFNIALSQTSVSRCLTEVTEIINRHLSSLYIKFPTSVEEQNDVKRKFFSKFGFPGVIGCVDGSHVIIKKPPNFIEHAYVCVRKSAHSKNVQLICDADLMILNVNAKFGGTAHDNYVFKNSAVSTFLKEKYFMGCRDSWLLGDSGYAQLPWIMTPISEPANPREESFNTAHKRTRVTVERCIGVLKSRFRCLSRQRVLMYSPLKAGQIINACCILHNIMMRDGYPLPNEDDIRLEMDGFLEVRESDNTSVLLECGRRLREQIIRNTF